MIGREYAMPFVQQSAAPDWAGHAMSRDKQLETL
jgi:hypothetical protein